MVKVEGSELVTRGVPVLYRARGDVARTSVCCLFNSYVVCCAVHGGPPAAPMDDSLHSLPAFVRRHALTQPLSPAVVSYSANESERESISYGALATLMSKARQQVVQLLSDTSLSGQHRVAFNAHNSATYLVHALSCMELGIIVVHLNWRMPAATLGDQLSTLRCVLLCTAPALEPLSREAADIASRLHAVRVMLLPPVNQLHETVSTSSPELPSPSQPARDAIAVVFFTSGSTGKPKAIPHTHEALIWWATSYTAALTGRIFDDHLPRSQCACSMCD